MSVGPLRRSIGALGLLALVPVAAMMLLGTLSPVDAARRAATIVVVLLLVGRLVGWGIGHLAGVIERPTSRGASGDEGHRAAPREASPDPTA